MLLDRTRIERVGMERKNWQEMSFWCQYLRPGSHYLLIYFRCGQIILPRRSTGYLYRVLWSLFHHSGLCCFLWPCWFSQTDRWIFFFGAGVFTTIGACTAITSFFSGSVVSKWFCLVVPKVVVKLFVIIMSKVSGLRETERERGRTIIR